MWTDIDRIIASNQTFVITSHIHPDGDAIGTELALCEFLRARGKDATIINTSPTPVIYRFLDPGGMMRAPASQEDLPRITAADAILIVDINDWKRLGMIGDTVRTSPAAKAVIDHHPYQDTIVPTTVIDVKASSTAELMYDLITSLGGPLTRPAANGLYTGILTDTGSFRFGNTTPTAHTITARLLEAGVQPAAIYDFVYNQNSEARLRLMGRVLSDMTIAYRGQVAWIVVTQQLFKETGALPEDTSSLVDATLTIAGVEIGLIFVETAEGTIRVSLRSRGRQDVNKIAGALGGGGHRAASGAVLPGPLDDAIRRVTGAIEATMNAE
ncbi:MAG: bifunctional oligoribonuclease/PAP phosphatase NrnA [Candidatus Latescibacteria bacterium]|nr:bifunctional oligoribonuclease/PAP phosphatase NrnA [Candidatus Latescibacterota bacterium]